jgi:hypothetical protein
MSKKRMKEEHQLSAHLVQLEQVVQAAKPLLGRYEYPDDYRTVTVIGFMAQIIEHQEAVLLLIDEDLVGSALALMRPVVEAMYRGLWIDKCATDEEVKRFIEKDEIEARFTTLAKAIDEKYETHGAFEGLKKRTWSLLNSLTHTGMHQLKRRFTAHDARPSYTEAQIIQATTTVTTCVLILISQFFASRNYRNESLEIENLLKSYGPLAQSSRGVVT